jgi:hypothetical protein
MDRRQIFKMKKNWKVPRIVIMSHYSKDYDNVIMPQCDFDQSYIVHMVKIVYLELNIMHD